LNRNIKTGKIRNRIFEQHQIRKMGSEEVNNIERITVMKYFIFIILCVFLIPKTHAQNEKGETRTTIISEKDFAFLEELTKAVLDSSRILPGKSATDGSGLNNSGGILIRPGGRNAYPSFWIRDYAMALDCGFVTREEQKHMLLLTASTQCDQPWITKNGSFIPYGSIADHIRIDDSKPIYFPGTTDYTEQGNKIFGMVPPYSDQYFFIHMVYYYVKMFSDVSILSKNINGSKMMDRLEIAFNVVPSRKDNHIVYTTDDFRGVDFGFRDVITITGDLCMPSIFKYRAARELTELFNMVGQHEKAEEFNSIAFNIKEAIPGIFADDRGMLKASTGKSNQPDVWSTALAVEYEILEKDDLLDACKTMAELYRKGEISYKGHIRHIAISDDFNEETSWEISLVKKNTYQNGAYWGTPVGWVGVAIARVDRKLAKKLVSEYIAELRKTDFRRGKEFGGPFECFYPPEHKQNPIYLTSVACPYISIMGDR